MYPWTCAATFKSKISSNNNNDNNNTLTDSRKLMALLDELIHGKATVAVRDELIDITGDDAGLRLLGINILLPGNCCRFER